MIRRPPRSTRILSSAASDVYKRQFYSNVDENDIKECEVFEEFLGIAKDKCKNIWSEDDLNWIANYVWNDYWSKY